MNHRVLSREGSPIRDSSRSIMAINVIEIIKSLNFPQSKYIIIGGAAMAIRDLKETRDIDILVSEKFLEELKQKSAWEFHPRIIASEKPGLINKDKTVELYPSIAQDTLTFSDLKSKEEIIEGVPFANLIDIIKIKEFYNREKDLKDIELIRTYLKNV